MHIYEEEKGRREEGKGEDFFNTLNNPWHHIAWKAEKQFCIPLKGIIMEDGKVILSFNS